MTAFTAVLMWQRATGERECVVLRRQHHFIVAFLILVGVCRSLAAQDAVDSCTNPDHNEAECNDSRIEHVIVTATRRESSVQKVPASITALDGKPLTAPSPDQPWFRGARHSPLQEASL